MDLEHKARKVFLSGFDLPLFRFTRQRGRGNVDKTVQELTDAEIVDRTPEKDRGNLAGEVFRLFKIRIDGPDHLDFLPEFFCGGFSHMLFQHFRTEVRDLDFFVMHILLAMRPEQDQFFFIQAVHTLETLSHPDRPAQRGDGQVEFLLDLVQEVKPVLSFTVQFVDKHDDRRVTHPADFHQSFSLFLHTFRYVYHHDHAIHGRQRPEGILGKILVARGVEDIDFQPAVGESHDRCGHGDAPLAFDLHKVGSRMLLDLVGFYRPGDLDRTTKKQQLFCQCRLSRIRVADDPEGPPFLDFFLNAHLYRAIGWQK